VYIIVAVVTALGSVITALIGWLARKGVNFRLSAKTWGFGPDRLIG
jgi:hypothetical protein